MAMMEHRGVKLVRNSAGHYSWKNGVTIDREGKKWVLRYQSGNAQEFDTLHEAFDKLVRDWR